MQKEPSTKGSGSKTPLGSVALFPPREEFFPRQLPLSTHRELRQ
ncbi:hypothetical protein Syncc8109_1928 [Synechococcus sp. WH 8109]|nr:hypothetical protein Syncc8109_1928 [Synechococcus sp. WH 8109]